MLVLRVLCAVVASMCMLLATGNFFLAAALMFALVSLAPEPMSVTISRPAKIRRNSA